MEIMLRFLCLCLVPIFLASSSGQLVLEDDDDFLYGTFPEGFIWSTATSAYQIEGGWDADGKGWSNWDTFTREGIIIDGSNGDVACDSYNKADADIQMLVDLQIPYYRFSISWARVMPEGRGAVNQAGLDYYHNLLAMLDEAGIETSITLFHFDTPQALEDEGGWLNEDIVEAFAEYSRLCFSEFGDSPNVRHWITFNEPLITAYFGYGLGVMAPGNRSNPGEFPYMAAHNILKAHAASYHIYDTEFRESQQGEIGITLNTNWAEPRNNSDPDDIAASDRFLDFFLGWYAHPIFLNGDYPEEMKTRVLAKSLAQGFEQSRLPEFTEEEKLEIQGTSDFFGLNFYTSDRVWSEEQELFPPHFNRDKDVVSDNDPDWPLTWTPWIRYTPFGLRRLLNWIKDQYGNPRTYVTENGVGDLTGNQNDTHRVNWYRDHINNVLKAIELDGCDIFGYTAWSLMDNFEWTMGYTIKFGMHYVNFTDPERPRLVKESGLYYQQIIEDNGFPPPDVPDKN